MESQQLWSGPNDAYVIALFDTKEVVRQPWERKKNFLQRERHTNSYFPQQPCFA